ncbi:glutaredoxin 3 [Roseovarius sp. LXJ103]|nr:glutaredoxin 3 [Roseovarius carneus]MBZ8118275.1 glutaredoxin 3 [Roseovarius carneus]PWE36003.1 glutaredoxin 3 [Pelagicola sp. LXJ1103]
MKPNVTIYTKGYCPHCKATKALLSKKGVSFTNHDITNDPVRAKEMMARAKGRHTVPQIFIGDFHVGGNSDLRALNSKGALDAMLRNAKAR